ncbi:XdhC/CoxI family protein [Bacillus sp. JJ1521]|uniref:XdhC family protein n=1 Tax=Bacillus sp. JJ1521 TaxID=3122957 RepID=UPI002FFFA579
MNDIHRILQILKERKMQKFAMATVIKVEGSAYRREGAKMLIDENGTTFGMISGGCLEEDLTHHAKEVMQTHHPKIVTYDMKSEGDAGWGQGAGCNGIIYVYIEETGWDLDKDQSCKSVWDLIYQKLISGKYVVSLLNIDKKQRMYCSEDGDLLNYPENADSSLITYVESFLELGNRTANEKVDGQGEIIMELFQPKERLYIFGAGPDVQPVVELAAKLDFSILLIDPRNKRCNPENFPTADHYIVEHPHIFLQQNEIPQNSFVLIMTHNFQWDQKVLKYFVKKSIHYLGILGPKRRTARLLDPEPIPDWIHSPVGMDIDAEGSEEIAVSICAELIKKRKSIHK